MISLICPRWYFALVLGWIGTMLDHSGYGLQAGGMRGFHDFHHENFTGNYGTFTFMDRLHGTDKAWRRRLELEAQGKPSEPEEKTD